MAVRLVCDGCGKTTEDQAAFKARGSIGPIQRHYCGECDEIVTKWLVKRDDLHSDLAARWEAGLADLVRDFFSIQLGFELPDIAREDFESDGG